MKPLLFRFLRWLIGSGWFTFLLFCLIVPLGHHLVFLPADIRGRNDFLKFEIAVQDKSNPTKIAFCTLEPGSPRDIDLQTKCKAIDDKDPVIPGSLLMKLRSGRVPMVKDEPDYGWTRYTVLSDDGDSQLIETETYYNSDGLVTRYRVTGNHVEPVGQIFATRGLNQMFLFLLPALLLFAWLLTSLLRTLAKKVLTPAETQEAMRK